MGCCKLWKQVSESGPRCNAITGIATATAKALGVEVVAMVVGPFRSRWLATIW